MSDETTRADGDENPSALTVPTSPSGSPSRASDPLPFELGNYSHMWRLAEQLSRSRIVPEALRGNPADVLVVLGTGRELGLAPFQALQQLHVIEGKVGLSAQLLVARVLQSGLAEYFRCVQTSAERSTYATRRKGWGWECSVCGDSFQAERVGLPCRRECEQDDHGQRVPSYVNAIEQRLTFTMDDAASYGLAGKSNWRRMPAVMLRHRAASQLARDAYPDVIGCLYTADELGDIDATAHVATPVGSGVAGLLERLQPTG
jgi:hypothetical protein